ncbi:MAG: 3-dehydroquinate synthase [Phascolarctobacterium sp.]|nr:MAG: 3-dehydroquinate synthase [Phascolarctobacterium sp.]
MSIINVNLGVKSYQIEIAAGLLQEAGAKIRSISKAQRAAIISDSNVDALYGDRLQQSLSASGFKVTRIVFPAGEKSKCLAELAHIYDQLAAAGITRSDLVVALGGGVTGDLGGFAAATFLRGVDYVQVPTSLLAQIDSSVGGKVAVDLPAGKNLVGNFYQPKLVLIDTELLRTLPVRFLHDGLAEAIKYGCIRDRALFDKIAAMRDDEELLANIGGIVERCCAIKAEIVEHDEFDTGERMVLNFGHTIGHAVEKCCGYTTYTHGEAVGIGMALLTRQTERLRLTKPGTAEEICRVLKKYNLPVDAPYTEQELLGGIGMDKKKSGSSITLIILKEIGSSFLQKTALQALPDYVKRS